MSQKFDLYPALQTTDRCNKKCRACLRGPKQNSFTMTWETFQKYLDDLRRISPSHSIAYQFVTGGEPTIWTDKGKDIRDIVSQLRAEPFVKIIAMPTNGRVFEDYEFAVSFLTDLSQRINSPVVVGISVARYQNNFDDNGCVALDNVLEICQQFQLKIIPILLVTLSQHDRTHERLLEKYPSIYQRITALAPLGKAHDMVGECPSISLAGNEKSSLGSFLAPFRRDVMTKLKLKHDEFETARNLEILNNLSLFCNCGNSPFIKEKWHYCLPYKEHPQFDLCEIGNLQENTISDFINQRPILKSIRENGIISTVNKYKHLLTGRRLEEYHRFFDEKTFVPVAYRGCMVCQEIGKRGIWKEIEENLSPREYRDRVP